MSTPEPFPAAYCPPVEDIKEESSSDEFSSKVFPPGAFPPENCLPADREPINVISRLLSLDFYNILTVPVFNRMCP